MVRPSPATQNLGLTERARNLRRQDTRAEAQLWNSLRNRRCGGWKWKRQVPRGPFIVDFYCAELQLIVEVDGATHGEDHEVAYDRRRTAWLEAQGMRVIRFYNRSVYENRIGVCDAILTACGGEAPHLTSPRERGEE